MDRISMTGRRIGVYDYDSCVECLRANFRAVFPERAETDAQDMIQAMMAEIMLLRRL